MTSLRVAVNQLSALGRRTGVGYYAVQLFRALKAQAGPDQIEAFPRGLVKRIRRLGARVQARSTGEPVPAAARRPSLLKTALRLLKPSLLWGYDQLLTRHARRWLNRKHFDLYHEPNYLTLPCDLPTVMTLHDLSVYAHPEWHPPERVGRHQRHFERSLKQCVHFLTDSEFIRQEVIQTLGLRAELVSCVPLGVRPHFRPLPSREVAETLHRLGLPPRYLLYLGTIEPRKNVLRLMQAYCSLPALLRDRWPLLLVGGWGWKTEEIADYYHREGKHRGVRHLGYLDDEHLAVVYNGARALVFPSYYEGFGLPPLEMMACGGAVLASTAGSIVETVGTRAHLVEPEDSDGWRSALLRVVRDNDWWEKLREGTTEVARPYTWQRCAAETLRTYHKVCGRPADEAGPLPRAA